MVKRGNPETLSKQVRDLIRTDVLGGRWAPGDKLQLAQLSDAYDTSSTVIREALTRLTGERLVTLRPNRGFFVPDLSLDELVDNTELRCRAEEFGVRLAVERGDLEWESELIAAHHRLERTPRRDEDDPNIITAEWSDAHQFFHSKLIEACNVPILIDLSATLSDTTELYRRWAAPATRRVKRDVEREHREILDAVLARDADLAAKRLRAHYETTIRAIVGAGVGAESAAGDEGAD